MKMTREQKYRMIEQAEPGEIASLEEKVEQCHWRQAFHIQPPTGLLNDPNGFSYYQGEYHLFYQWFPLGTDHGMKYWYHLKSKDLVTWNSAGIGIAPGDYFDSHGAYSGSALEHEGKLYMLYTEMHEMKIGSDILINAWLLWTIKVTLLNGSTPLFPMCQKGIQTIFVIPSYGKTAIAFTV